MLPKHREVLERINASTMPLGLVLAPAEDREAFLFLLREGYIEGKERNREDFIIERVTERGLRILRPQDFQMMAVPPLEEENPKKEKKSIGGIVLAVAISAIAGLVVAYLKGCFPGVFR